jgi:hypothetical protein
LEKDLVGDMEDARTVEDGVEDVRDAVAVVVFSSADFEKVRVTVINLTNHRRLKNITNESMFSFSHYCTTVSMQH